MMASLEGSVGQVVSLWRYPVKSMMGEQLDAAELTPHGLLGDRAYALVDVETGKVVSAKNPRKWPGMFAFSAAFVEPPEAGKPIPPVRITLPDGSTVLSTQDDADRLLSAALGRQVTLRSAVPGTPTLEEYWPDIELLERRDTVTDEAMPPGTFFDLASLHILTTNTLEALRKRHPEGRFELRRFRPNVVVTVEDAASEFPEDGWLEHTVAFGQGATVRVTKPCPRCVMTTLAQGDLPADPNILRTAAREHRGHVGVYAEIAQPGPVRTGDSVCVQ